jgi:ABC-type transport system substrate-binding protein
VRDEREHIVLEPEDSLASIALGFRLDRPPFIDGRLRRAVDLAIDRDTLIRELSVPGGRICGPVNPHLGDGYWALTEAELRDAMTNRLPPEERIAEAGRLLDAAGARGARFSLQVADLPELVDVAAVVRTRLQAIDLAPQVETIPLISWYANLRAGAFDATLIAWSPHETPAAALRAHHSSGPTGAGNSFAFRDAAVDAQIERAWREPEREQRRVAVLEAQRLLLAARPCLPLFTGTSYTASRSYVRDGGFELPGSLARYHYRQWLAPDEARD